MDEKKKFELNDEMLNEVSGGADKWKIPGHRVGETFKTRCPGVCVGRKISTAVITEIIDENTAKIKMDCCGREFVLPRRESGEQQHFI